MTLKAFIFLTILWNSSICTSANKTNHLRFWLGCRAEIPCQHEKGDVLQWFYKKDEHSENIQIFFQDKSGVQRHNPSHRRGTVTSDRSFVISEFTEDDQGLYWCEICHTKVCKGEERISVTKVFNLTESHETVYVTEGNSFTYSCQGEFNNFKWTFDATALGNSAETTETDYVTFNKSIHIRSVKRADAGKYTFWVNECNGRRQKICTVNLCVTTVHHIGTSSVSCDVMCKVELSDVRPDSISTNVTGRQTISVHVNPHGPLNCSAEQMYDSYTTVNAQATLNASVPTSTHTPQQYLRAIIYGTSAAITSLVLLALFIFFFTPRLKAAIPDHLSGSDINEMAIEESLVVYSSVVVRTPAKTTNRNPNYNDCVYSEIRV